MSATRVEYRLPCVSRTITPFQHTRFADRKLCPAARRPEPIHQAHIAAARVERPSERNVCGSETHTAKAHACALGTAAPARALVSRLARTRPRLHRQTVKTLKRGIVIHRR